MKAKFLDLLERSIIMQGLLTLAVAGTILYLVIAGRDVPEQLYNAFWTILGFFFGSKVTAAGYNARNPSYYDGSG